MVKTDMHIITGPTLMESGLTGKAVAERVVSLSTDSGRESVILLAHGDPDRAGFWNRILESCADAVKAEGFTCVDYQLVGMGQNLKEDIEPLLAKSKKAGRRTIVQGIYLVSTARSMAQNAGMSDESVIFGSEGILPRSEDDVLDWIVNTTKEWAEEK